MLGVSTARARRTARVIFTGWSPTVVAGKADDVDRVIRDQYVQSLSALPADRLSHRSMGAVAVAGSVLLAMQFAPEYALDLHAVEGGARVASGVTSLSVTVALPPGA